MQESLTSIDQKVDALTMQLDAVMHKIKKHDSQLKEAEQRICTAEDDLVAKGEMLLNMEKILKVIAAKNEELKASGGDSPQIVDGQATAVVSGAVYHSPPIKLLGQRQSTSDGAGEGYT
ncbi:hypothetical protein NDU88_005600 [Pleurodeles waltl]|uniref:Uncharacterized protein n=1 Tax=Pleurodeles waltl TaxID=8319 RepID=A0AAV7LLM9_PLEWA|nr:hypothetical protein NDU88_005600 [Pleurodeles waltl]